MPTTTYVPGKSLEDALRLLREIAVFHRKHHNKWWYKLARRWGWRKNNRTFVPWMGICGHVPYKAASTRQLCVLFERWPENSGVPYYPVVPPQADNYRNQPIFETLVTCYLNDAGWYKDDIWVGEYGDRRMRLLDWTIGYLENERLTGTGA